MMSPQDRVLDNPVWAALSGPHARFAQSNGRAARYRSDITPFASVSDWTDDLAWHDLAGLAGPAQAVVVTGVGIVIPPNWARTGGLEGVQMIGVATPPPDDIDIIPLTVDDVPEMIDLVRRTEPGPFLPRTIQLGSYLGIRRAGALVAMAGERIRVPGGTEISAVCTDPAYRGQGLAGQLVRAVAAGIMRRGETPFLHAAASNTSAIRLYERLGFKLRTQITFAVARRVPAH
jgi:predicted GNAT family acetyltransferase